jgi:hypothetical protein
METNLSVTTAERRGYISDAYSEILGLGHRGAIRIITVYLQRSAMSKVAFGAPSSLSFFVTKTLQLDVRSKYLY